MSNFSADKLGASFITWSPMEQPNVAPDGTMYWDVITEQLYIKQFGVWDALSTATGGAPLNSPHFTGIPTAPTAAALNNSTQLATTAYTDSAVGVETARALAAEALLAALASPHFTGVPTAPTAAPLNNSTQLATTAYADAIGTLKAPLASPTFTGTVTAPNLVLTAAAPTVAAAQIGYGSTTSPTATNGGGQTVLSSVLGYIVANVAGTTVKIPYFSV